MTVAGSPKDLASLISRICTRSAGRTEAELQADIRQLLLVGQFNLDDAQVRKVNLEVPLSDSTRRRIDIEVGHAVIEVKKDLDKARVKEEAVVQLTGYVASRHQALGTRFVGILTDGRRWHLYKLVSPGDELSEVSELTVRDADDGQKLIIWLEAILATREGIKPTSIEIDQRLGVTSPAYQLDIHHLSELYGMTVEDPEVALKRRLWARLLRTALGTSFKDDADLFINHTLLALEANIIAHAVSGLDHSRETHRD